MAVHAGFPWRLERLLGLRRVLARLAPVPDALDVKFVLKLHATHRRASQDDGMLGLTLAVGWQHQHETEHDTRGGHANNRRMLAGASFMIPSSLRDGVEKSIHSADYEAIARKARLARYWVSHSSPRGLSQVFVRVDNFLDVSHPST
jgi:hypothetical protein